VLYIPPLWWHEFRIVSPGPSLSTTMRVHLKEESFFYTTVMNAKRLVQGLREQGREHAARHVASFLALGLLEGLPVPLAATATAVVERPRAPAGPEGPTELKALAAAPPVLPCAEPAPELAAREEEEAPERCDSGEEARAQGLEAASATGGRLAELAAESCGGRGRAPGPWRLCAQDLGPAVLTAALALAAFGGFLLGRHGGSARVSNRITA